MRRLSFDRDRLPPPAPRRPISGERDFVAFINELNREWVEAARRLSPRVLTDLHASVSLDLAAFFEQAPLDAPALFGVSWAGESESKAWFDIGREFTEQWHHQAQIRDAVGAPAASNPEWLRAVLAIAMRGLRTRTARSKRRAATRSRSRSPGYRAARGHCGATTDAGRSARVRLPARPPRAP